MKKIITIVAVLALAGCASNYRREVTVRTPFQVYRDVGSISWNNFGVAEFGYFEGETYVQVWTNSWQAESRLVRRSP